VRSSSSSRWASTPPRTRAGCTTAACGSSAGGIRLELDWPDLASFPDYGLTRTRMDFDDMLATAATDAGAVLRTGTT
jgi:hypothetical protein